MLCNAINFVPDVSLSIYILNRKNRNHALRKIHVSVKKSRFISVGKVIQKLQKHSSMIIRIYMVNKHPWGAEQIDYGNP